MNYNDALSLMRFLVGLALLISSLELLNARSLFSDNGLLSWSIMRTQNRRLHEPFESLRDALLGQSGVTVLLSIRAICAALIMLPKQPAASILAEVLLLLAICLMYSYRARFGGDGSDQMAVVVLGGLLFEQVERLVGGNLHLGLWFVAIQLAFSYLAAGFAKITSEQWRSGDAIRDIMRSSTYGSPRSAGLLVHFPILSKAIAWSVIVFEVLFSLAIFGPSEVVIIFLVTGLAFHVLNAAFMGLNTFLPAFAAAYPAIVFLRQ